MRSVASVDVAEPGLEPKSAEPEPALFRDPFGWYASMSVRRPWGVFCAAWTCIVLMCAAGLPMFEQTPQTDYDWLLGGAAVTS
jgi:hypothetical protein